MVRLIAVIALLGIGNALSAQQQPSAPLPDDSHKWNLAIFTSDRWRVDPNESEFVAMFDTDPTLSDLKRRAHWHHYTAGDVVYKNRFAKYISVNQFPCVWFQRPDGGIVYKASGDNTPRTATDLVEQLRYYTKLDPYSLKSHPTAPDSRVVHGISQNGSNPLCPDGNCPLPNQPYQPQPYQTPYIPDGSYSGELADSATMFNRDRDRWWQNPVKNSMAAVIWILGGVVALFVFLVIAGLLGLVLLIIFLKGRAA